MEPKKPKPSLARIGRGVGAAIKRVVGALMIIGSSLGPARGAGDPEARKGYEKPDRDYRP